MKTLIILVTYYFKEKSIPAITSLLSFLDQIPGCRLVILDNNSQDGLQDYLKTINHSQVEVVLLPQNIGKAVAINTYLKEHADILSKADVIISMDGDITFSKESLEHLIAASSSIPSSGMISMRYVDNGYSPEMGFPEKPTTYTVSDKRQYQLYTPEQANIAGGIFAMRSQVIAETLGGKLYPGIDNKVYCSDDYKLYHFLKEKGTINGYLEGAIATHHGEGTYLFAKTAYSKWKFRQLTKHDGSTAGYFERKRSWIEKVQDFLASKLK